MNITIVTHYMIFSILLYSFFVNLNISSWIVSNVCLKLTTPFSSMLYNDLSILYWSDVGDDIKLRERPWFICPKLIEVKKCDMSDTPEGKKERAMAVVPEAVLNRQKHTKSKKYIYEVKWMHKGIECNSWVERDTVLASPSVRPGKTTSVPLFFPPCINKCQGVVLPESCSLELLGARTNPRGVKNDVDSI